MIFVELVPTQLSYMITFNECFSELQSNLRSQQGEFEHDEELVHSVSLITIQYTPHMKMGGK